MTIASELERLEQLHRSGALNDQEYAEAKSKILQQSENTLSASLGGVTEKQWAVILHLSQFAGYFIPLAGFIVPILIWQLKKNEMPSIDEHGRMVCNWIISSLIYTIIAVILCFVLIGLPLIYAILIVDIIFPIIGAVKANDGIVWKYPMTMKFF